MSELQIKIKKDKSFRDVLSDFDKIITAIADTIKLDLSNTADYPTLEVSGDMSTTGIVAVATEKLSTPRNINIVGEVLVDDTQDLMLLTSIGKMIRVDMQTIRKAGRNTSGVIIVNMDKDDKVVSIAKCPKEDEEIELDENGNIIRYNEDCEVIETSKDEEESLLDIIDNKEEE